MKNSPYLHTMALIASGLIPENPLEMERDDREYVDKEKTILKLSEDDRKAKEEAIKRNVALNRGLKEFDFNGNKVYARNEKNAIRKAKNAGYL